MTIYILDIDPKLTAQYLDDKSLDIMIKDIAQVLCTIHYWKAPYLHYTRDDTTLLKSDIPLKPLEYMSKFIWKWSKWGIQCKANYIYLCDLIDQCLNEYYYRYTLKFDLNDRSKPKIYYKKYMYIGNWARDNVPDLEDHTKCLGFECENCHKHTMPTTPLPLVMPKKYQDKVSMFEERLVSTVLSYRDYYQAKIKERFNKHLNLFNVRPPKSIQEDHFRSLWTRQCKPEWLNI